MEMKMLQKMEAFGRAKWHGQETVPQHRSGEVARSGDRATTGMEMKMLQKMETFGRAKWHGRETVPQHVLLDNPDG
jgi:hypothetical protein